MNLLTLSRSPGHGPGLRRHCEKALEFSKQRPSRFLILGSGCNSSCTGQICCRDIFSLSRDSGQSLLSQRLSNKTEGDRQGREKEHSPRWQQGHVLMGHLKDRGSGTEDKVRAASSSLLMTLSQVGRLPSAEASPSLGPSVGSCVKLQLPLEPSLAPQRWEPHRLGCQRSSTSKDPYCSAS